MNDIYMEVASSRIHKLNYAYKFLSILFMFVCVIIADSAMDMFIINFFIFILMILSDIRFRIYLKNVSMFFIFLFLIFFVFSLICLDLYSGILLTLKIFDLIMYISIVSMTSTFYHLAVGVRGFLFPFRFFVNIDKFSLWVASLVKFIDCLYSERIRVHRSAMLRGVKYSEMGFVDRIDNFFGELGSLVRLAIFSLDKQRSNVLVKKYGVGSFKYNYRLNKWGKTDTILLVINIVVMFITFVY